jgi:hypothetical protein
MSAKVVLPRKAETECNVTSCQWENQLRLCDMNPLVSSFVFGVIKFRGINRRAE